MRARRMILHVLTDQSESIVCAKKTQKLRLCLVIIAEMLEETMSHGVDVLVASTQLIAKVALTIEVGLGQRHIGPVAKQRLQDVFLFFCPAQSEQTFAVRSNNLRVEGKAIVAIANALVDKILDNDLLHVAIDSTGNC